MHHWLQRTLIIGMLMLPAASYAQQKGEGSSPNTAGQDIAGQDIAMGSCEAVARLNDRIVCRDEVEISAEAIDDVTQEYKANGIDPKLALKHRRLDRLATIIWDAALKQEFGDQIVASTDEISAYNTAFKSKLDSNYDSDRKTLAEIEEHLASGNLTPDQTDSILELRAALRTSITFYEERARQREALPSEFFKMMADTEREMAEGFLRQWNIAQLLYHKYGGSVVSVSGRYEPVDAYSAFLKDVTEQDGFEIYDSEYAAATKLLQLRWDDMKQAGSDVTKQEADDYFASALNQFNPE